MKLLEYATLYEAPEKILYSLANPREVESILANGFSDGYFSDDIRTLQNNSLALKPENGKYAVLKVQIPNSAILGNQKTPRGIFIKRDKLNRAMIIDVKYKSSNDLINTK